MKEVIQPRSLAPDWLRAPWPEPHIQHGFFGRTGGASGGRFAELNLSRTVGDAAASVDENWRRVSAGFPANAAFATLRQVHGNVVHTIDGVPASTLEGDGFVTAARGLMLSILTADCVPVLMVDANRGVAGALHAGWRGTLAGIARCGVRAMVEAGAKASEIRAALGPSIGVCCFEVDEDVAEPFRSTIPDSGRRIRAGRQGKSFIDLRSLIADELERCGVPRGNISAVGPCTKCTSDRYFSRRAARGVKTGLQLSCVGFV